MSFAATAYTSPRWNTYPGKTLMCWVQRIDAGVIPGIKILQKTFRPRWHYSTNNLLQSSPGLGRDHIPLCRTAKQHSANIRLVGKRSKSAAAPAAGSCLRATAGPGSIALGTGCSAQAAAENKRGYPPRSQTTACSSPQHGHFVQSLLSAENYLGFFFFFFLFHFAAVDPHPVAVSLLVPAEEMQQSSGEVMAGASQALLPAPFSLLLRGRLSGAARWGWPWSPYGRAYTVTCSP